MYMIRKRSREKIILDYLVLLSRTDVTGTITAIKTDKAKICGGKADTIMTEYHH